MVSSALLQFAVGGAIASDAREGVADSPPVFGAVWMVPEHPFGDNWGTGTGGDIVKVYAYINNTYMDGDGLHWIEFSYSFCNEITCIPREYATMDYLGNDLFVFTFPGDTIKGWQEFSASHHSSSHVTFYIWADSYPNAEEHATYPAGANPAIVGDGWKFFYPAWPPSVINGTASLSKSTSFPGETITVSGNAKYWNSTSLPKDLDPTMSSRIDCEGSFVNVTVNGVKKMAKVGANGDFSIQITAPASAGSYPVTFAVNNGSANRNVPTSIPAQTLTVVPFPSITQVTVGAAPSAVYPGKAIWVNGTAKYANGSAVKSSTVYTNLTGQSLVAKTSATGTYSQAITAPAAPGAYTVTVTVQNATYKTKLTNTTSITVQTPVLTTTMLPNTTTPYPSSTVWVNGTAVHGNGDSAAGSQVQLTFVGTGISHTTAVGAGGAFTASIQAPAATGVYALNTTVTSAQYANCKGYKETAMSVSDVPVPDFVVDSDQMTFAAPGGLFLEGKVITISSVVSNLGNAFAPSVQVACAEGATLVGSLNLTGVGVGASAFANFTWTATPGNHTFTITADPLNATEEAFENNNAGSATVTIDADADGDDIGDETDPDDDNDGYNDTVEASEGTDPFDNTSVPADVDGDFIPDSTDPDIDGDGVLNEEDAFPEDPLEWSDLDDDGIGDNSDGDLDGDGVDNDGDAYPMDPTESTDTDGDGTGDNADADDDADGWLDAWEDALGADPKDADDVPADTDGDGAPDGDAGNSQPWMDEDDDGDGVDDENDAFPRDGDEWDDLDGDGAGDNSDGDWDGDGYANGEDPFPRDTDNDGLPNAIDLDDDGDGLKDSADLYPFDTDNDGQANDADRDDDGDGATDIAEDANWNGLVDEGETAALGGDTDGDGIPDGTDPYPTGQAEEPGTVEGDTPGLLATLLIFIVVPVTMLAAGLAFGRPR
jgi:hypothetical protein